MPKTFFKIFGCAEINRQLEFVGQNFQADYSIESKEPYLLSMVVSAKQIPATMVELDA